MVYKVLFSAFTFVFFLLLFVWFASQSLIGRIMRRTFDTMDAAARQRVHENRQLLNDFQEKRGFLHRIEQRLIYCGLTGKYRWLTLEMWILMNLIVSGAGYFAALLFSQNFLIALSVLTGIQAVRYLLETYLMGKNYRAVNDNLMKFLDFLGNYSITAGEVTGILKQISKYMEEPLGSVLDECYYEAQTSGDSGLALLAMAEKIEHPRFKELVRNMEISIRYSADFTSLVRSSRRAVREHMRTRLERKTMVNEALVNMLILAGMSIVILVAVEQLIGTSMQEILFYTWPGRVSVTVILVIFLLLYHQIRNLDK